MFSLNNLKFGILNVFLPANLFILAYKKATLIFDYGYSRFKAQLTLFNAKIKILNISIAQFYMW